jgi:hypothetical protein
MGNARGVGEAANKRKDSRRTDANNDADILCDAVADAEENKRDNYDDNDSPELNELRAEDGRIAIGKYGKEIAFDVHEGEKNI